MIATKRGSPIAGLQAWSGNSEGFITTVVDLTPIQTFGRLRWRMASDTSGSNEGWRVDTVNVSYCHGQGTPCASPTFTPTPSATATATPTVTPTLTPSATPTASRTPSVTPTATPTPTVRPTPTARP